MAASRVQVLSVAAELFPLIKTGGLADVTGALPAALALFGVAMRSLVPAYPNVLEALGNNGKLLVELTDLPGGSGQLRLVERCGHPLYLLDAPALFDRPGNPYAGPDGADWSDNGLRFAALAWAATAIARGIDTNWRPAVVHCHDWPAGLVPAYLQLGCGPLVDDDQAPSKTVMTVHNLAFQGQFSPVLLATFGLPGSAFTPSGVEYYGSIGFLKAGLNYADALTTVSPSYALEIQSVEQGMGLGGLLRHRAGVLEGIVNGIDEQVWNPATDPHLPTNYDAETLSLKSRNKQILQRRLGLDEEPEALLACVVSRLTYQKGMDLLLEALPEWLGRGGQLAVLGTGDPQLETAFTAMMARYPGRLACVIGHDEPLSHLFQGGSDTIVVPSRFEPCGLTQLYGLRYGTLPIVARTGGLADTVIDANHAALATGVATGLQFAPITGQALRATLARAQMLFAVDDAWHAMQQAAMRQPVGWAVSAERYAALYRRLIPAEGR